MARRQNSIALKLERSWSDKEPEMRAADAKRYKLALEAKRSELLAAFQHREDIVIERSADEMDNLQLASQRELAISHLHMESSILKGVVAALSRIEDGSYGICRECEEPISPKRLQAVPWAAYCRSCQEAVDRGELEDETLDQELGLFAVG
jgi:DnaK suppressor protein